MPSLALTLVALRPRSLAQVRSGSQDGDVLQQRIDAASVARDVRFPWSVQRLH
jgi:hypothetical protein